MDAVYKKTKMIDRLKSELKAQLLIIKKGLDHEGDETKEMVLTYINFTKGRANKAEMKKANKQFRTFLKTLGLGTLLILPFAPITIPFIVKLGKHFDIDIIPHSFKN